MNALDYYLDRFWEWSGLTPKDYLKERISYKLDNEWGYLHGEWEERFPDFNNLEKAFVSEISNTENFKSENFIGNIVYSIAIDNELERFAEIVTQSLNETDFKKILNKSIELNACDAQWQLVTRIPKSKLLNKLENIHIFIQKGGNDYVKDRAKYVYENINEFE
jgi:hypothetical protein